MHPEVVLEGDIGKLVQRIDQPVRIIAGTADQGHRIFINQVLHGAGVDPEVRL